MGPYLPSKTIAGRSARSPFSLGGSKSFLCSKVTGKPVGESAGFVRNLRRPGIVSQIFFFKLEPLNALPHTIDINSQQSDKSTRPLPFVNLQWLQHCYSSNNYGDSSYFGRLAPDGCESRHGPMDRKWERSYSGLSVRTGVRAVREPGANHATRPSARCAH